MKDLSTEIILEQIRAKAEIASGTQRQLVHRALSYHEVYVTSNRICCFALIASHGALWANWYLRCARLAAMVFALLDIKSDLSFRQKLAQFDAFTFTLREINRQVMIATYSLVHALHELGPDKAASCGFPEDLCHDMAAAMQSAEQGIEVSTAVKRDLYERHFRWEQKRVVGDMLRDCFEEFTWQFMRNICLRPWVWFAYFRSGKSLNFRNFLSEDERVDKGLVAFDRARVTGWDRTESRLKLAFFSLGQKPRTPQ